MEKIYEKSLLEASKLFDGTLYDTKVLYLQTFNTLPNVHSISNIDGFKFYKKFEEAYTNIIIKKLVYRSFLNKQSEYAFDNTIFILTNNILIEIDENYCQILNDGLQMPLVLELTNLAATCKAKQKKQAQEINLIVQSAQGLTLKTMEIKKVNLNLNLFFNDDFIETEKTISKRLNTKNDKGIVLLHGVPGTGKTTYLRYLIGKLKKKVLFVSPNVAANLMNPDFIELLIANPNSVLIIEDAENIIMDRKYQSSSSVSNLLNISDGLLSDFLNVQLICTFNSELTAIDSALLRKGRLIAKHEFKKLSKPKAQILSNHFGFDSIIQNDMTLAEIANPTEKNYNISKTQTIGFGRDKLVEN